MICKHPTINLVIDITHRVSGPVATVGTAETDAAIVIRCAATCADCGYANDFSTKTIWGNWPIWLTQRIAIMAVESGDLRIALRTLKFPLKPAY